MTVEELRDLALSASEAAEHEYKIQRSMLPFNELARRLEEAQQVAKHWEDTCQGASDVKGEVSCAWTLDPDGELWDTGCGQAFCLSDGTPKENDMIYCPFCGNRISAERRLNRRG